MYIDFFKIFSAFCPQPEQFQLYNTDDTDELVDDSEPYRFRVGSRIHPYCDIYFTYSGEEAITCQSSEDWSGDSACTPSNKNHSI